jgi:cytochrome c oxidase subunit II
MVKIGSLAVLLAAIGMVVALLVGSGQGSTGDPLSVHVFSKHYSWSFGYPEDGNAFADELHLPLGREIRFDMHSQDVDHAFWVPEWRMKMDIPPAKTTTADFTPDKAGTYQLICAQECGILHLDMRAKVVVEPQAEFEEWVDGLKQTVPKHLSELISLDAKLDKIHAETNG